MVSLSLTLPAVSSRAGDQLTMMLIPLKSPSTMYRNFLPLKRYLEERLETSIEMKVARKSSDIVKHLERGDADLAFVCPTLYCVAFSRVPIVPLARLSINGVSEYRSVLLVREDSPVNKTADLLDRTFVYGRYHCPGSGLLPRIMLQRVGLTDEDFLEVVRLGSDESAITAVMARMFDATGVPEMAARPYIGKGLRVLRYSNPIPQYLFVARASLGSEFIERLKQALLSVNGREDRSAILGGIEGADGLSEARDMDYDIVRVLMKNVTGEKAVIPERRRSIKFVVEPVSFEPDVFRRLTPLMSHLSKVTGVHFQLLIPESLKEFREMQKTGRGDLFLQNRHLYAGAAKDSGLEFVGTLRYDLPGGERGLIITHSEGDVRTPRDLRGRKVGITSFYSDAGYLAQRALLQKLGVGAERVGFVPLGTFEEVIMQVYRGAVDAGFVSLSSLRSMEDDIERARLRVLAETAPLPPPVIGAKKGMDSGLLERIRAGLLDFMETDGRGGETAPRGRR